MLLGMWESWVKTLTCYKGERPNNGLVGLEGLMPYGFGLWISACWLVDSISEVVRSLDPEDEFCCISGLKKLESLNLSFTGGILDSGLRTLATITSLTALNLDSKQITDAGLAALTGFKILTGWSMFAFLEWMITVWARQWYWQSMKLLCRLDWLKNSGSLWCKDHRLWHGLPSTWDFFPELLLVIKIHFFESLFLCS